MGRIFMLNRFVLSLMVDRTRTQRLLIPFYVLVAILLTPALEAYYRTKQRLTD